MDLSFFVKPNEGEDLANWCAEQKKICDSERRKIEPEWGTNILFLAGRQWESAADDMRRFGRVAIPSGIPNKVKITSNKIIPLFRQAQSVVADNIATAVAISPTSDEGDIARAKLATDFINSRVFEDREQQKRRAEIAWAMTCGRCVRFTSFDPDADGFGIDGKMEGVGDISSVTLNPWQTHFSPWNSSTEGQDFVIVSDIRTTDYINDTYKPAKEVKPEEVADSAKWLDRLVNSVVIGAEYSNSNAPKRSKAAILNMMYCKPTRKYPQGRVITWANGVLLKETTLPESMMTLSCIDWLPIPGRQYPLPFITPLRDLQHQINITLSQLIALKNKQLSGDILVDGEGMVTTEYGREVTGWDITTGQPNSWARTSQKVIRLGAGVRSFQQMQYNLNANEAEVLLSRLWNDMMDAAGIRETTLGNTPPSGTTATQIMALKESDAQGMTFFRAGFNLSYCDVDKHKIVVAANHYDIPRMVRVVGKKNAVSTQAFFGSDLQDIFDVRPRSIPMMTETQELQMRSELAAQGAFDLTGTAQQKLSKVKVLLGSSIPGIQEEVETLLGGMTVEDLEAACAVINENEIKASIVQSIALVQAAEAQAAMQDQAVNGGGEQEQELNPMDMMMQLAGGGGQAPQ